MTGHRRGIVTGGTWCVDYNRTVSHWPDEDGLAELLGEERHGGGPGCNLAIDIKTLDPSIPVDTIGLVGDDDNGRFLRALADAHGIGTAGMAVTAQGVTQFCDAFVSRASHRRTHIFCSGVGDLLTPEHFSFEGTTAAYLHLGLPGVHRRLDAPWGEDESGWVTVLKRARAAGLKTNLELASLERGLLAKLTVPCLPHLDFIVVNDGEIGAIAGIDTITDGVTDIDACIRAARAVLEKGAMELAVVHYPSLAMAVTRDGRTLAKPSVAVPPADILGANGAGDAFASGILYGVHEGWDLDASLALAHAAAAVSLRSISTTEALEPWRECLRLADQWGWRG